MLEYSDLVEALGENDARIYADLHALLEREFMAPEYYHGICVESPDGWIPDDGSVESQGADCREGWLVRLSASGYLDCTDWAGPFDSQVQAFVYLVDTYAEPTL